MKILKHPILILFCAIALFIYIANRLAVPLPSWVYFYVNDFLCMPIVLSLSLAALRFIKRTDSLYVPFFIILLITTYYGLYFEWLMPQMNSRYTADPIDVGLYFSGAFLFFKFQKRLF